MEKIRLAINVDDIKKDLIQTKTFKNKEGEEVSKRVLYLDAVPLKDKKFVFEGDNYKLWKTHFVAHPSKKDEETFFVGDGLQFENKEDDSQERFDSIPSKSEDDINPSDIPF